MFENNLKIARSYYNTMNSKDLPAIAQYLHDDIVFIGPMAEVPGKDAFLKAIEGFMSILDRVEITSGFASESQAMLAYDLHCQKPFGTARASALFTIENELIKCIELFYDSHPFRVKKDDIFSADK